MMLRVRRVEIPGLLLLASVVGAAGCSQVKDHFADVSAPKKEQPVSAPSSGPNGAPRVSPPVQIIASEVMEFTQGKLGEYVIEARAENGARPVLSVRGLPEGARFLPEQSKLSWVPSAQAFGTSRVFIDARIGDASGAPAATREVTFLVHPNPARAEVVLKYSTLPIVEGQQFEGLVTVESQETPEGPFTLRADGLPIGAEIGQGLKPSEFLIRYRPDHRVVSANDAWSSEYRAHLKRFDVVFHVMGKNGEELGSKETSWSVADRRIVPELKTDGETSGIFGVEFTVTATDQNGEEAPDVRLLETPAEGSVTLESTQDGLANALRFRWENVPDSLAGKSRILTFEACSGTVESQARVCATEEVSVSFVANRPHPPLVRRETWKPGFVKLMRQGDRLSVSVAFEDLEAPSQPVKTVVQGTDNTDVFGYAGGKLWILAGKAGARSLKVTATASQGLKREETFDVFVLPKR